jgi:hypothetical protein
MQKIITNAFFIILISCLGISNANSQITKNNWMIGGNGRLSFQKETLNSSDAKGFNIQLSPSVGYFFVDNFSGGIRAKIDFDKVEFNGAKSKTTHVGIGPFLRYYFLSSGNMVNLFAESAYQYSHYSSNIGSSNSANSFTFSAGPVIYLNTSVGVELSINYELYKNKIAATSTKTLFLGIGFQIHLEKDNN